MDQCPSTERGAEMALEHFHEPREQLSESLLDLKRAKASLIEELEAANWYNERAEATRDDELRSILEHNRDEEIEHAVMLLEWIRRNHPGFNEEMETYLFKTAPVTQLEREEEEGGGEAQSASESPNEAEAGSLNIGSMKGE